MTTCSLLCGFTNPETIRSFKWGSLHFVNISTRWYFAKFTAPGGEVIKFCATWSYVRHYNFFACIHTFCKKFCYNRLHNVFNSRLIHDYIHNVGFSWWEVDNNSFLHVKSLHDLFSCWTCRSCSEHHHFDTGGDKASHFPKARELHLKFITPECVKEKSSAVTSPQSCRKAYNTAESRPCTQIATVSSVRLNIWQNVRTWRHGTRR